MMQKFKILIYTLTIIFWSATCFQLGAANATINGRALRPDGANWGALNVDSSGNLKVALQ